MSKTFAMVNGDVVIMANGQAMMVEGYDKIQQDINHALSHPYDAETDFGNELLSSPVTIVERAAIPGYVQRHVSNALSRLRRFQSFIPRKYLPDNEKIDRVKSVTTTPIGNLGVAYLATVSVVSRSDDDVRSVFRIQNSHLED